MNRWIRSGSALDPDLSRPPRASGKTGQIERGPDIRRSLRSDRSEMQIGLRATSTLGHQAVLFFCDEVHPSAGGEIVRRLGAAVEHNHQRKRLPLTVAAGDEE